MAARRSQRGIADMWLVVIGAIVILSLLAGITYAVKGYLDGIDSKAFARGESEAEAKYVKRDNDALRAANVEIAKLRAAARKTEENQAKEIAAASKNLQTENDNAQRTIADLRRRIAAGGRLRDPGATGPACSGGGVPTTPAGAGGRDDRPGADLSGEASIFLLDLAGEADAIARQLKACQAVVRADRKP